MLSQLAQDEGSRFPLGSDVLNKDVYVDDILSGAATLDEARGIFHQLRDLCMAGGFPLKKWASNEKNVLKNIPVGDLSKPGADFDHRTRVSLLLASCCIQRQTSFHLKPK